MDNKGRANVPGEVLSYYNRGGEAQRLLHGEGRLEFARTQDIIGRYSSPPPGVILDVGGGTGVYAFWLAELGYEVHLIDATPLHIEQAQMARGSATRPLASARIGDARQLPKPDRKS